MHGVELVMRVHVMWLLLALENALAVVFDLVEISFEEIACIQVRVVIRDLVRANVIEEPQKPVGDHGKADPVVQVYGCFERHQAEQVNVTDLEAGQYQCQETQCVRPMPDSHRHRVEIDSFVLLSEWLPGGFRCSHL